jgi:hypothetical protein
MSALASFPDPIPSPDVSVGWRRSGLDSDWSPLISRYDRPRGFARGVLPGSPRFDFRLCQHREFDKDQMRYTGQLVAPV